MVGGAGVLVWDYRSYIMHNLFRRQKVLLGGCPFGLVPCLQDKVNVASVRYGVIVQRLNLSVVNRRDMLNSRPCQADIAGAWS